MLNDKKRVLDWRKNQRTKAAVRAMAVQSLHRDLANLYPAHLLMNKNELIHQHISGVFPSRNDNIYAPFAYE